MGLFDWLRKLLGAGDDVVRSGPDARPRRYGDAAEPDTGQQRAAPSPRSRRAKKNKRKTIKADVLDIAELARRMGMSASSLQQTRIAYHEFSIPKRSGGRRPISAPAADLKSIQRRLLRRVFAKLRAHPAAMAFERGRSVVTNAAAHTRRPVVIKMDLRDFFNNTAAMRIKAYFERIGWRKPAAQLLTDLCTHKDGLPQGAPTSPRLSNLVNFGMDVRLAALAKRLGGAYTRYADDITFSLPNEDRAAAAAAIRLTKQVAGEYGYKVHTKKKLRIMRAHNRQQVTGLVVNESVRLPRPTRRWLRAVEHRLRTGRKATLTHDQLKGWRAYDRMVARQS